MAAAPAVAAPSEPELPKQESPWTSPTKVDVPATPAGVTKAPGSEAETEVPAEVAAWRAARKARTTGPTATADGRNATGRAAIPYLPEGQGEVPWHRILDTRLNDATVARVNLSNGNLMLAATDFDIAGVGH
ncbi:hypothetical protein [Streptomyces sp. A30]|uniref:hypothetical protein n=1 Tax=Streptomyces sp. A30 TaxID=2789273 RepID=UPI003980A27A